MRLPDLPDRIIFDFDPDPGVPWKQVMVGAREVRDRLAELGLESFLKTTGGKGLHVTVPIIAEYGWLTIKVFARAIAQSMEADSPDEYTTTLSKDARKGKIFIDYLRNELTATAVAPFSARVREDATVATPLNWKELTPALTPAKFTIETVPLRLTRLKRDPWKGFNIAHQKISKSHLKALEIPF